MPTHAECPVPTFTLIEDAYSEVFTLFSSPAAQTWTHNYHVQQKSQTFILPLNSKDITITQDRSSLGKLGVTGTVVWDSSVVLAKLCERGYIQVKNKMCLEVGCGTGLLGIALSVLGAEKVVMTDRFEELKHSERNVRRNEGCEECVQLVEFEWGSEDVECVFDGLCQDDTKGDSPPSGFDLLFASDCVYNEHIVPTLVKTLLALCMESNKRRRVETQDSDTLWPENTTLIVISQELRSDSVHLEFLEHMIEAGFRMARIESVDDVIEGAAVCVYVAWLD